MVFFVQVIIGQPFGDNPAPDGVLIISLIILLAVKWMMVQTKLETIIEKDCIRARLFPLQIKFRQYPWESIRQAYIRTYNPILEYGGWGLRGFGKNKALNISGNKGLQLEFHDNKRLLIGTRKPDELEQSIKKIKAT